jgi:hypothetical protein
LATTPTTAFSDIVEAVRAVEEHRRDADLGTWLIGKKLIAEVGPPDKPGKHTGSTEKFEKISKVLVQAGYPHCSDIWLRKVRDTTYYYTIPADRRLSACSFWVHEAARNPDNLDKIVKEAKANGKSVTVKYAQDWHKRQKQKPKRRSDVIAKMMWLTSTRTLTDQLPEMPLEDVKELRKESSAFTAACDREIACRTETTRQAAE